MKRLGSQKYLAKPKSKENQTGPSALAAPNKKKPNPGDKDSHHLNDFEHEYDEKNIKSLRTKV